MKIVWMILLGVVGAVLHAEDTDAQREFKPNSVASNVREAFLPGVAGSVMTSLSDGKVYPGFSFHYAFVEGISHSSGPSDFGGYYEWYSEVGLFKEVNSALANDIFFTCGAGINLSFEKFLGRTRNYLNFNL